MNFIIDLSLLKGKNIILTVICRLTKKRHYISCSTDDEEITAEKTAELMLQWIYQIHDLLDFIVSNRDFQFIFILWKFLCKRLSINLWLFTVYHFQIDDQSERVNQNVERYLRFFCLYMQNNWAKLLLIIEFVDNNALFSVIFSISFFFILVWALNSMSANMKVLMNACRQLKSRIYLNIWTKHWSLLASR